MSLTSSWKSAYAMNIKYSAEKTSEKTTSFFEILERKYSYHVFEHSMRSRVRRDTVNRDGVAKGINNADATRQVRWKRQHIKQK